MSEHSVQVVISEPGGQQVRVSWRGAAPESPVVLQVASSCAAPPPRHEMFPPAIAPGRASAPPAVFLELRWSEPPPPALPQPSPATRCIRPPPGEVSMGGSERVSAPLALSLELCWGKSPALRPPPTGEAAPLAAVWAAERLRQRHAASVAPPLRRRSARAGR